MTLSGQVTGPNGQPRALGVGASPLVTTQGQEVGFNAWTNESGHYSLGVPAGDLPS